MTGLQPLSSYAAPGEQTFRAPGAVREMCRDALAEASTVKNEGGEFAVAFAQHIAGGEPVGMGTLGKLREFLKGTAARQRGGTEDLCFRLMGGDPGLAWAGEALKAEGHGEGGEGQGDPHAITAKVLKVDEELGIVFGWAIICKENGTEYFDTQDDHIPESSMLKAAADFMAHSRVLGDMHQKNEGGAVVFCFPMTEDIALAFGMVTKVTGLMIGVKPQNAETLAKFKSGEYTGFSIGGRRLADEVVTDG